MLNCVIIFVCYILDTLIYEYDIYKDKVKNPITNEWENMNLVNNNKKQ